jgi:DNA-nicking Smr family endonuclease
MHIYKVYSGSALFVERCFDFCIEVDMEPMELPIEDSIDLHSFQPKEVAGLVEEYLHQARLKGYREVRIIHGRGVGVQRSMVHSILSRHPQVISFCDETDRGSTLVKLAE